MRPAAGLVVVFLAAAAVLMLEILAARMLAPYVGVSLNTYTGIIGTVLAGIAAGTWAFGQLVDRYHPRLLLGPLLVAGGLLAMASGPLVKLFGEHVHSDSLKAIVALSGVTFFLPAFVLSGVTPVVVKQQLQSLTATGRTVGRLSGAGTFGALVGTFGTGFFLTSRVHTHTIVLAIGIVLVCLGIVVHWRLNRQASIPALASVLLVLVAGGVASSRLKGPCQTESAYFCINVEGNQEIGVLRLDNLTHSAVALQDHSLLELPYARAMAAATDTNFPSQQPLRVLQIGAGAFTLPLYFAATRRGTSNAVFEIDPAVVDTARRKFGVRTGPLMRVKEGDARVSVADAPKHSYDVINGDAFASRSVPWHLTTIEFLTQLRDRLRPDGIYVMNLIDAGNGFLRAELATMRAVWPSVTMINVGHNHILVGARRPIDQAALAKRLQRQSFAPPHTGPALDAFIGNAKVLTDDFAPVDQLLQ